MHAMRAHVHQETKGPDSYTMQLPGTRNVSDCPLSLAHTSTDVK